MGLKSSKEPLPLNPIQQEIDAYSFTRFQGPSELNFRWDFGATLRTPWNGTLLNIFVETFKATEIGANMSNEEIIENFTTHYQHLRARYKQQICGSSALGSRRNPRRNRRITILQYRKEGCYRFTQLDHFQPLLELLGVKGMSEDESDLENGRRTGTRVYHVKTLFWRAKTPEFLAFLEILDMLYMSTKYKVDGTPKAGNWPRVRVRDGKDPRYKSTAVAGLPENFYDAEYLTQLKQDDPRTFLKLKIQPAVDLTIDPRIIGWVATIQSSIPY